MSRKHFIKIAEIVRDTGLPEWARIELAERLADMCQEESKTFDRERFLVACNAHIEG